MRYPDEARRLRDAALALSNDKDNSQKLVELRSAISTYEATVCAKAWEEARLVTAGREVHAEIIRRASADVVSGYIREVAKLREEIRALRAVKA